MRQKIVGILVAVMMLGACSSDDEKVVPEAENRAPVIQAQSFEIIENAEVGVSLGTIVASDPENDALFFNVNADTSNAFRVNRETGELTVLIPYQLDFEARNSIVIEVFVNDGVLKSNANITINLLNEEDGLLSNEERRTITDFTTVVVNESIGERGFVKKWEGAIKVYLDGNIADEFRQLVLARNSTLNSLMTDGAKIELVGTQAESNVHIFLGAAEDIENIWPDIYGVIAGGGIAGIASLDEIDENYFSRKGRIWLSEGDENLYFHEFGHILGFGHIDRCDPADILNNSIMCPVAVIGLDLTPFDKDLFRFTYHPTMLAGTPESEVFRIIEKIITGTNSDKKSRDLTSKVNNKLISPLYNLPYIID